MFILHHFIDVYALFLTLSRRQASMTQAEKFLTLFAQERALCSIIWLGKRMLRVVASAGSVLR